MPGERHRPDRDPRPRARAPDHQRHAARGARRRRRCATLLERMESGDGHRPLRRHHRAVGARARDPHRPPVRVPRRRGAAEPAHQRGHAAARARRRPRVDRRARPRGRSSRCTRRSRPSPTSRRRPARPPVLARGQPRRDPSGSELWTELAARGRGPVLEHDGARAAGAPPKRRDDADRAFAGDEDAIAAVAARPPRDLRHHHRRPSSRDVDHAATDAGRWPGSRCSSTSGFALQGRYTPDAVDTEWVARRLLARMHSYSRRTRRERSRARDRPGLHALPAALAARRARHPARRRSRARHRASSSSQGYEAAAVAWEPDLLARRLRRYDPAWLDRLCHDGEVGWLRLNPRRATTPTRPPVAPSKATPISVRVPRRPAVAARSGARRYRPGRAGRGRAPPRSSRCCASAARASRPSSGAATNRLPEDIERALWDGVARGLLTSDGFGAIRARVEHGERTAPRRAASPA